MYCSPIHLYIHLFIHLSIYSFSFFFFIWEGRGGGRFGGIASLVFIGEESVDQGEREGGSTSFWPLPPSPPPPPFSPFSIVSAFQSIPFVFFYVLTFRLFLLWNGLLFCLINYLCISTYFKSTEISKIWFLAIWAWYKNYFRDNYLPKTQLNVIY